MRTLFNHDRPHTIVRLVFISLIGLLLFIPVSGFVTGDLEDSSYTHKKTHIPHKETWITIFVHGIISIKPHLNVDTVARIYKDDIDGTLYAKSVETLREDPFFFQNQPMQGLGLQPVALRPLKRGAAATLLAHTFEVLQPSTEYRENHYYTFGWSGLMSYRKSYEEAQRLYKELSEEVKKFNAHGITPKIRLIGYSRGGKLIMDLANVRQHKSVDQSLHIDEVILYGTPVHTASAKLLESPLFEKIYNVYSPGDRVQKLDVFSCKQFFSCKLFPKECEPPSKLVQIELRVVRRAGDRSRSFLDEPLNRKPYYTNGRRSHLLRDVSPGHSELWFFGWTPLNYRRTFPLYPLPIVALTPYIVHTAHDVEHEYDSHEPIVMSIDPRNEVTLIKRQNEKFYHMVPFISRQRLHDLQEELLQYKPIGFTHSMYEYRTRVTIDEALLYRKQYAKDKKSPCCNELLDTDEDNEEELSN